MAEAALSSAEHALENQRIGSLQIRVAMLCTPVQIADGYDASSIGWAVPPLTHAWNLPFAIAFMWSSPRRRRSRRPAQAATRLRGARRRAAVSKTSVASTAAKATARPAITIGP